MSLKDLLPEGTYDEIIKEAHHKISPQESSNTIYVNCPNCGKKIVYSSKNLYRPFCSERCKFLDLGAWANEERTIAGNAVNEDQDADLLNDPKLPKRFS